ncbi:uncharacterized protein LOC117317378 [Pecten maximus]|uniref:uncharacterized protein LOC117317378 n=1 Tax=Pecten maximus TaxID=6579 RepID=UPI0014584A54|nr:uncharacterized protein LOC117317378 [Pecten maximus]
MVVVTKMMLFLLCIIAVLPFGRLSDTDSAVRIPSRIPSCHVDDIPGVNFRCPSDDSGYVAHGKHCQNVSLQTQSYIIMCSRGKWISVPTAHTRSKRSTVVARIGTAIGIANYGLTVGSGFGPIGAAIGGVVGAASGIVCALFCFGSNKESPSSPNLPPSINWHKPNESTYYVFDGNTFAVVGWSSPTANDKEDGTISVTQISGRPSRSKFFRGEHIITYRATDSKGLAAFDHYTFNVIVIVCSNKLSHPTNGRVSCNNQERIAGTTCTYSCDKGYLLDGDVTRTCILNGKFTGQTPRCES